jgi:hypothetical protein
VLVESSPILGSSPFAVGSLSKGCIGRSADGA